MTELEKPLPPNDQIVQDVLDGKYGQGYYQRDKLRAEGYDPEEIQSLVFAKIKDRSKKPDIRSYTETSHRMKTGRYEVIEELGLYIWDEPSHKARRVHYYDISGTMLDKVSKDGRIKNGTSVMIVNFVSDGPYVWGKTSSGWICVRDHGRMLVKKM